MSGYSEKGYLKGLSESEAKRKLAIEGFNELPSAKPKSIFNIILDVIKEPMFILLVACGTLYMLLGDIGEGMMLLASVIIIIIITFYQEKKTERALEALRELSSPRALVIRDGVEKRIAGREVVAGDIILLQEGDRVPADAFMLEEINLKIDESLLTGESVSVRKGVWRGQDKFDRPSGEGLPFVYSGTLIVQGSGMAKVAATGTHTELGRIGKRLQQVKEEPTLLQKETAWIIKTFSVIGFGVCIILIIVYGLVHNDWLHGILSGLSLAMALLPEEFAVVLTIFMALGAWRMSQKHVLTRNASSIETLGSVTVLCADKTGTLTLNKMSVRKLFANGRICELNIGSSSALDEDFHLLVEFGILASQANPFDPMEKAIIQVGETKLAGTEHIHTDWQLEKEYPLTPKLLAMSRVFHTPDKNEYVVAAKGSPEAIADLCHLSAENASLLKAEVEKMASAGLRVLGVARAVFNPKDLPKDQHEFNFEFIGFIGLEDPLREEIAGNLRLCYEAGVRLIMITGDYPVTAQNIAKQMGLKNPEEVLTGKDLHEMDELQLKERIRSVNIFARVSPDQKLLLVEALKDNGEIVAMTGDGVNDAPALKSAHIGIAMGQRGTDVAREAADLVLTDDNFSSIISSIRMGRRIYENIQKAMGYIFSVHLPIAGLTLIPVMFHNLPMILFPLHIAFLELIIDPASSLIFEGEEEEKDIMKRKPRDISQPIFGWRKILLSTLQGGFVMLICFAVFFIAIKLNRPENEVRALTFTTLIIANLGLILVNRSWTRTIREVFREKNPSVKWVVGGAVIFLFTVLYTPGLRDLFHFDFLHIDDLLICFAAGVISVLWFEGWKVLRKRSAWS